MKIVSFDVGIKNMAYCILEVSGNCIDIRKWGIMDLVNSVSNEKKTAVSYKQMEKLVLIWQNILVEINHIVTNTQ